VRRRVSLHPRRPRVADTAAAAGAADAAADAHADAAAADAAAHADAWRPQVHLQPPRPLQPDVLDVPLGIAHACRLPSRLRRHGAHATARPHAAAHSGSAHAAAHTAAHAGLRLQLPRGWLGLCALRGRHPGPVQGPGLELPGELLAAVGLWGLHRRRRQLLQRIPDAGAPRADAAGADAASTDAAAGGADAAANTAADATADADATDAAADAAADATAAGAHSAPYATDADAHPATYAGCGQELHVRPKHSAVHHFSLGNADARRLHRLVPVTRELVYHKSHSSELLDATKRAPPSAL